jgi:hypothetical protein
MNPAEGMDVRLSRLLGVVWIGSGLCDGLITRSEESYRLCVCVCVCVGAPPPPPPPPTCAVCDLEISATRRPRSELGCSATKIF